MRFLMALLNVFLYPLIEVIQEARKYKIYWIVKYRGEKCVFDNFKAAYAEVTHGFSDDEFRDNILNGLQIYPKLYSVKRYKEMTEFKGW